MLAFIARRFAIFTVLIATFALAGCGDKEPQQRKAFIEFLQKEIISSKRLAIPSLKDKDKEDIGSYAAHYQLILDFNKTMNEEMKDLQKLQKQLSEITTVGSLQKKWQDIPTYRAAVDKALASLDSNLQKIQTARDGLKQPDDLKAVYDEAFGRTVTKPGKGMKKLFQTVNDLLKSMEDFGKFLDDNKDKLKISGPNIEIEDPTIMARLQVFQSNYNEDLRALQRGYAAFQKTISER